MERLSEPLSSPTGGLRRGPNLQPFGASSPGDVHSIVLVPMSAIGYKWIYKSHPESIRFHQERRSRHDQSEGPPTGKGESGAENQKAGSRSQPTRPKNSARAIRSGSRFDKRPDQEYPRQELRRRETGRGAVEIGRAIEHPSRSPSSVERGDSGASPAPPHMSAFGY